MSGTIIAIAIGASVLAGAVVIIPTVKMAIDLAPYIYATTRCSARSGMLLNKKKYQELLGSSSYNEFLALLEDSYYGNIAEHGKSFSSLSNMVDEDLYKTYRWLENVVPEKLGHILSAMRRRFEVSDIKAAINRIRKGEAAGELEHVQDETLKLALQGTKDLQSVKAALESSRYRDAVANTDEISEINIGIDRIYHDDVMRSISKADKKSAEALREYWRTMVDLMNLRLAMRKINLKMEEMTFIPGGLLDTKNLSGISDATQLQSVISESKYSKYLKTGEGFIDIEIGMFRYLRSQAALLHTKYTLYAGGIIKYIIMKEIETRNLNVLLKLKQEDMQESEISKFLITES